MATFLTRFILDEIRETREDFFEGDFVVEVMELNIWEKFSFKMKLRPRKSAYDSILIYKNGKIFLRQIDASFADETSYTDEQWVVLIAFEVIFSAYRGKLDSKKFALTTIEKGRKISVSTATPDTMRRVLMKACCL